MSPTTVFLITFITSLIVYSVIVAAYVAPWIAKLTVWHAMQVLLIPHVFHQVGLATLLNDIVEPAFPARLSWAIAIGDLAVLATAIMAALALRRHSPRAANFLWLFTLVGVIYNGYAGLQSFEAFSQTITALGTHWYISALYVPLLLVSHVTIFYNQVRRRKELRVVRPGPRRRSRVSSRSRRCVA